MNNSFQMKELFRDVHGDKVEEFLLPPPSFTAMDCEVIAFDKGNATLTTKIPVLKSWLNPYGTMQGGMIVAAIDNTIGPLSMLIAPQNMTRNIESKLIKAITMDVGYIYVSATLFEKKKRRLIFDVVVKDIDGNIYTAAKITNWII